MSAQAAEASTGTGFPQVDEVALTNWVKENPVLASFAAASAGFILGGGARSRLGFAVLMLGARLALRETIAAYVAEAFQSNGTGRRENRKRA